jgi:hypothetical protein
MLNDMAGKGDAALAKVWFKECLKANPKFFAMMLDRVEGRLGEPADDEESSRESETLERLLNPDAAAAADPGHEPEVPAKRRRGRRPLGGKPGDGAGV